MRVLQGCFENCCVAVKPVIMLLGETLVVRLLL
jgi:hypothetical protein